MSYNYLSLQNSIVNKNNLSSSIENLDDFLSVYYD